MDNQITFSQALEGYLLYADASRLSPRTIADYTNTFRKFQDFLSDDPPINEIAADQVRQFMAAQDHISKKTLLNYHTGLSALWTWAAEEDLVEHHIIKKVARPDPEKPAIKPYTRKDVEAIVPALSVLGRPLSHKRPEATDKSALYPSGASDPRGQEWPATPI